MNPSFLNLFMKKFTRERVAPIISASVSCEIFGSVRWGFGLAVARQQQQRPGEPLFAGVEELIDEIRFDADVPGQHVGDEAVRRTSGSSWSSRTIASFSMTSTVLAAIAVAVPMRTD